MKTLATGSFFFFFLHVAVLSQTTAVWIGGTPGMPTEWNCASNWSESRVPDENAQVIIPSDLIFYPVIRSQVPDIDAMLVSGGAMLTIEDGVTLTILGDTGRLNVLTVHGKILNEGKVHIVNPEKVMSDHLTVIHGNGIVQY